MLVSLEWLKDLVDISNISPEKLAHELTMSGLEVESIEHLGPKFSKVYTGIIEELNKHPNAEKIRLAKVNYGFGQQEVVCGAKNIAKGQIIAFAIEGAKVFNRKDNVEFTLKKTKIRGVESSGMICSASELCLEGPEFKPFEEGVVILSEIEKFKGKTIELGVPVEKLFDIPEDIVLHTAPTANRGDLLSIRGVANEVAAIFNLPIKRPTSTIDMNTINHKDLFKVSIEDQSICQYYSIGILENVEIKNSPEWLAKRLNSSGMRPINNVVDITNYVMLEFGQPLHAFDLDKLSQKSLTVRRAKKNEEIITLDGETRKLSEENVLISLPDECVALAGVMGGGSSEVDSTTKALALESAFFPSATTRKSSRAVGLRSESSARFERGVDIQSVKNASLRAMELLIKYANAKVTGFYETGKDKLDPVIISLRFKQMDKLLGINIPRENTLSILKNLDFKILAEQDDTLKVEVPTYRVCDVYREIDLIEEITRVYGYDKIKETIPKSTTLAPQPDEHLLSKKIRTLLLGNSMNEIVTSSLTGYPLLNWIKIPINEEKAIKVTNPQSDEFTMLRQSMVPSMLQVLKYNLDRDNKALSFFEIGKTYFIEGEPSQKETGVTENFMLCGAVTGDLYKGKWHTKTTIDFFYLKGLLENLFEQLKILNRFEFIQNDQIEFLHPGQTAIIDILGKPKNGPSKPLGFIGQVHPTIQDDCKFNQKIYLFEINLDVLLSYLPKSIPFFKKVNQYPAVERDIAFLIDRNISYQKLAKTFKKYSSNLLKEVEIFDIYEGKNIPDDKKSVAFHLVLEDPAGTLTDEVVEKELNAIRNGLAKVHDVTFR